MADVEYRDDVLMDKHDDECYKDYDYGFLHVICMGINEIQGGVYYGEKAVKEAFGNNKEKENKYLKLLDKIDHLVNEISIVAGIFKRESEK